MLVFTRTAVVAVYQLCSLVASTSENTDSLQETVLVCSYDERVGKAIYVCDDFLGSLEGKGFVLAKGTIIKNYRSYHFNYMADAAGVSTGKILFDVMVGMHDETHEIPTDNYMVTCLEILKAADYFNLRGMTLVRFWEWALDRCSIYLQRFEDPKNRQEISKLKKIIKKYEDEMKLKEPLNLETVEVDNLSLLDVVYSFSKYHTPKGLFSVDAESVIWKMNALRLRMLICVAGWMSLYESFLKLIRTNASPLNNGTFFYMNVIYTSNGYLNGKTPKDGGHPYHLCLDSANLILLAEKGIISMFWELVEAQIKKGLKKESLHVFINLDDANPKTIKYAEPLKILYNESSYKYLVCTSICTENVMGWDAKLKQLGLQDEKLDLLIMIKFPSESISDFCERVTTLSFSSIEIALPSKDGYESIAALDESDTRIVISYIDRDGSRILKKDLKS